ncbi:MAG TPA: SHOCT domain-containing protein [Ilumatobacteraceae bacterium]|jgi:predicted PurR-regulated permease PerM|nr:SHOCT domain-containing protein [Ilumatobacteraceae bacterium]
METTNMVGYDYPILGFFWSMLFIFLWVAWIFLLFRIIADIFRNHEMGGFAKALWLIFVVILPFLGVLIYVIVYSGDMAERDLKSMQKQQEQFDAYVRQTASSGASSADELTKLAALKNQGVITDAEFAAQKAKLLS